MLDDLRPLAASPVRETVVSASAPRLGARGLPRALIWAALIAVVWTALYLPNLGTPAFTGMEGLRYSIARETSQHGDWLQLYFNGAPYYNKPPLVTWMMLPALKGLDEIDEFALRLPFAVAMLAMALSIFGFAARWLSWERAAIAALVPLTSVGALRFGRACEIDGAFAVFFVMAVTVWGDSFLRRRVRGWRSLVLGLALGLGGLCKGPLIFGLFAIFCALVLIHGRDWRRVPAVALAIGALLPLVWVAVLYSRGLGHDALGVWGHQVGMRFVSVAKNPMVPPHHIQMLWGLSLTLPWSLIYPILYYPGLLPPDRRLGALLRGGRDTGTICLLGILAWPGMQYQYLAPVSLLMALEVGIVAVTLRPRREGLGRGLQVLTGALAMSLAAVSVVSVLYSESVASIMVAALGLLGAFGLLRLGSATSDASREIKYALSAMIAATAVAVICMVPPLGIGDNEREVGQMVKLLVPQGEQVYCPMSIDNLAAYTGHNVIIWVPNEPRPVVYAILRDQDVATLRQSSHVGLQELYAFDYRMGWRRDHATLHLVRLAATDTTPPDWQGILGPVAAS